MLATATRPTITDKVDTKAPVVSILQELVSGWTNSTTETITGNVTDGNPNSTSGVASVKIYDNGGVIGSATVDTSSGTFTFTKTGLTAGTHAFTVQATDVAGNTTAKLSAGDADKIDLTAPTFSMFRSWFRVDQSARPTRSPAR